MGCRRLRKKLIGYWSCLIREVIVLRVKVIVSMIGCIIWSIFWQTMRKGT